MIHNIAQHLINRAASNPNGMAVSCSLGASKQGRRHYTHLTFAQMNLESAQVALGMHQLGFKPGMRAILMVRPGPDLFVLTFALFKAGIAPILIDPGMQKSALKKCINQAQADLFIGINLAHWARRILGWGRSSIRHLISVHPMWLIPHCLDDLRQLGAEAKEDYIYQTNPNDLAAVLFTSGSTGTPKGAEYKHRHFVAQVDLLKQSYDFREGDVDIPTFPLFALFDPALGMSAVFPKMDFSAPLKADPQEIFAVMADFGAHNLFCSPALLNKLAQALPLQANDHSLSTLQRVISAGAPVSPTAMQALKQNAHPDCEIYTPYGATESLPVCSISCTEVWQRGVHGQQQGYGVCVGKIIQDVQMRIIPICDEAFSDWVAVDLYRKTQTKMIEIQGYEVGEIVVYTSSTTQNYLSHPQADAMSKIKGVPPGGIEIPGQTYSHRMGDLGYIDDEGYVWLCGRKSHYIVTADTRTYLPLCVEGILNEVSTVKRCALAQYQQEAVVCVELYEDVQESWEHILDQLVTRAQQFTLTQSLTLFAPHPKFPVDTRHNAKIKREVLSRWLLKNNHKISRI